MEENKEKKEQEKEEVKEKNSLEKYCDENPDALECKIYDV